MAIVRVQTVYKAVDGASGSAVITTDAITTTTGNTLIAIGRSTDDTLTDVDDGTNLFELIDSDSSHDAFMSIWRAKNITGVTGAITGTFDHATNFGWLYVLEYSGIDHTTPDDGNATGVAGSGTDLATDAFNTTVAGLVVAGGSQNAFATYTAGTDFTIVDGSINGGGGNNYGGVEEYITSTAFTGYSAHLTSNANAQWTMVGAAFNASSGGAKLILIPGR
mgnify:CR=1 FL=1